MGRRPTIRQPHLPVRRHYLYVPDAGAAMHRALKNGATLKMPVADMPYSDQHGGVRDQHSNIWWISQHHRWLASITPVATVGIVASLAWRRRLAFRVYRVLLGKWRR